MQGITDSADLPTPSYETLKGGISGNPTNLAMLLLSCVDSDVVIYWSYRLAGEIMQLFRIYTIFFGSVCMSQRRALPHFWHNCSFGNEEKLFVFHAVK
jgi:hypothetical protein